MDSISRNGFEQPQLIRPTIDPFYNLQSRVFVVY